jgi:UDP:flavonoid glycosyltransferase YjiC (YdhE family)
MAALSVLLAAVAEDGHVAPLLAVAQGLIERGHRVRFLTGAAFRTAIEGVGAEFLPWPDDAEVDHRAFIATAREAGRRTTGLAGLALVVEGAFLPPAAGQYRAILQAVAVEGTDAILVEPEVVGAAAIALSPDPHPPVIVCGIFPLILTSVDTAPFGLGLLPRPGPVGALRNRALNALTRGVVLRRPQRIAERMLRELSGARLDRFFLDWGAQAARYVQFTVAGFEYPRRDLPPGFEFIGPLAPAATRHDELPGWWPDLDGRRVVHVTQGTMANMRPEELILPTLRALAERDVLVVATTGPDAPADLTAKLGGALPANARVSPFLPYRQLLPLVDVFVTNGGYGGVQQALSHGVPIVAAGVSEDKRETSRRVAWSGVGIDLGTSTPTEEAIAAAVDRVLTETHFRDRAGAVAAEIAAAPGMDGLEQLIWDIVAERTVR